LINIIPDISIIGIMLLLMTATDTHRELSKNKVI